MSHAKIGDLPGWPCPSRVRDIAATPDCWGWLCVSSVQVQVAAYELGYLWVRADAVPKCRTPTASDASPGAVVFHDDGAVGIYIHPKSYQYLQSTSRLDHQPDEWLPVAAVAAELPALCSLQEVSR